MDSTTYKIIKYIVLVLNFLVLLLGLVLLGIGIWTTVDFQGFSSIFTTADVLFHYSSGITIAAGCVITVVGFVGCWGAKEDSNFLLGLYFVIVFLVVLLELAGLIIAFVFNNNIEGFIAPAARSSIATDYGITATAQGALVTSAWDSLQRRFNCCGYTNGTDYVGSNFDSINFNFQPWPSSCCTVNPIGGFIDLPSCISDDPPIIANSNAAKGCLTELIALVRSYAVAIGITSAIFIGTQVVTLVLAGIMFIKADDLA